MTETLIDIEETVSKHGRGHEVHCSVGSTLTFFTVQSHRWSGSGDSFHDDTHSDQSADDKNDDSADTSKTTVYEEVSGEETPKIHPILDDALLLDVELDEIPELVEGDHEAQQVRLSLPSGIVLPAPASPSTPIASTTRAPSPHVATGDPAHEVSSSGSSTQLDSSPSSSSSVTPTPTAVAPRLTLHSPTLSSTRSTRSSTSSTSSSPPKQATGSDWGSNFWCVITLDQHSFFANPSTGECRWTLPSGSLVLPPSETGQWWELWDARTSQPYFYHTFTKQSLWTRPTGDNVGIIIPMQAVQRSQHMIDPSPTSMDDDQSRDWEREKPYRLEQGEQEEKEGLTTHLSPMPVHRHRLRVNSAPRLQSSDGRGDAVLRARKSIVHRDSKALARAREGSPKPKTQPKAFKLDPLPLPQQSRYKRGALNRPATSPTTPTRPNAVQGDAESRLGGQVKRLGKGFAFDPSNAEGGRKRRKSLPHLTHKRSNGMDVVEVTKTLMSASLIEEHKVEEQAQETKRPLRLIKLRLAPWSKFSRCGRSSSSSEAQSSEGSFGNV